ncbi:MAG: heme biosynthesis HemY N-terminal domain-containing protein [Sphingomonadales bacterium]
MIRIILYLTLAIALAVVAAWFADNPGTVAVDWLGYTVAAPVALVLLLMSGLVILAALAYRLWRWSLGAPGAVRSSFVARGRRRGDGAIAAGLVAAAAADTAEARRQAGIAARHVSPGDTLLLLLEAQIAGIEGDAGRIQAACHAMRDHPGTELPGILGLIREAHVRAEDGELLPLAMRARELAPKNAGVVALALELSIDAGDWDEAARALKELGRLKGVTRTHAARARAAMLAHQAREAAEEDRERGLGLARRAHKAWPGHLGAALIAAELSAETGKPDRAAAILEQAWSHAPHPEIAIAYARLVADETPTGRLRRIERLAAQNPEHPESLAALVEHAIAARLPGVARHHLNALFRFGPSARACRLAGALIQEETGDQSAARLWRTKAALAPEPGWRCGRCRRRWADWSLTCPHCLAVGDMEWQRGSAGVTTAMTGIAVAEPTPRQQTAPPAVVAAVPADHDLYQTIAKGDALDAADHCEQEKQDDQEARTGPAN